MTGMYVDHDLTDVARRQILSAGEFVLCSPVPRPGRWPTTPAPIVEAFDRYEPKRAQDSRRHAFIDGAGPLNSRFTNDLRTKELVSETLTALGCDLERTYFDVPRLRVVPSGATRRRRDLRLQGPPRHLIVEPDRAAELLEPVYP